METANVKFIAHVLPIGKKNRNNTIISEDCKFNQMEIIPVTFGQNGPRIGVAYEMKKVGNIDVIEEVSIDKNMINMYGIDITQKIPCGSISTAEIDKEVNESGETISVVKSCDIRSIAIFTKDEIPASNDTYMEIVKEEDKENK